MTFYSFMIGFLNDETPLGFLAQKIESDKHFPKHETSKRQLHVYFNENYLDHDILESANRALSLYRQPAFHR